MLHQFFGLPGKPEVGWHWLGANDCQAHDHLSTELCRMTDDEVMAVLREIESRGPGRLIANSAWQRLVTSEAAELVPAVASPSDTHSAARQTGNGRTTFASQMN
jgi:hypothetical protein